MLGDIIENRNGATKPAMVLATIATLGFILGCASTSSQNKETRSPGLHSFNGWMYTRAGIDINGEVGYPIKVQGPTAGCILSDGSLGKWQMHGDTIETAIRIKSGAFPPGVHLDYYTPGQKLDIIGIPKERGHWIVRVIVPDVNCEGKRYNGFEQELRFHITGSGKVIN